MADGGVCDGGEEQLCTSLSMEWLSLAVGLVIFVSKPADKRSGALEFSKCMSSKATIKTLSLFLSFCCLLARPFFNNNQRENRCCSLVYY